MSSDRLAYVPWKKSSYSNGNGGNNCLEVAQLHNAIAIRDSKNPTKAMLLFSVAEWNAFLEGAKGGEFDVIIV